MEHISPFHQIPFAGEQDHIESPKCWCWPTFDKQRGIYVHHIHRRSEDYENVRRSWNLDEEDRIDRS